MEGRKNAVHTTRNIWHELDWMNHDLGKVKNRQPMGATRYGDLNSDLPVCIMQDFLGPSFTVGYWSRKYRSMGLIRFRHNWVKH